MVANGILPPAPRRQLNTQYGRRQAPVARPLAPEKPTVAAEQSTVFPTYEQDGVAYYDLDRIYKDTQLRSVFEEKYPTSKEYFAQLDKPAPTTGQMPVELIEVEKIVNPITDKDRYAGLSAAEISQLQRQEAILKQYGAQLKGQGAPTITLSSGEQVDWNTYRNLPPEAQSLLLEAGSVENYNQMAQQKAIEAQSQFEANTIQLPSGEYVSKDAYNSLSEEQKQILFDEGVGALQGAIEVQQYAAERAAKNAEIANAEAQARYNAQIAALPEADQKYIATNGIEAYNAQIERQNAALQASLTAAQPFITTNADGTQSIDIVGALQGNVTQTDLKNLGITDQQIADAYLGTPGFNAIATPQVMVGGKVGGHEVFEELIPYTNSTGSQVNAVQYLVDTGLDPNSVAVLQQVIPDSAIAESLQASNAIILMNKLGGAVGLAREVPNEAPKLLAQAGFTQEDIKIIQENAKQPPQAETKTQNVWQAITGWIGQTANQFKQNFIENFTGEKRRYYNTTEGQAELKAKYEEQQAMRKNALGLGYQIFLEDEQVSYDPTTKKYYIPQIGYVDISPAEKAWGTTQQLISTRLKTVNITRQEYENIEKLLQSAKQARINETFDILNKAIAKNKITKAEEKILAETIGAKNAERIYNQTYTIEEIQKIRGTYVPKYKPVATKPLGKSVEVDVEQINKKIAQDLLDIKNQKSAALAKAAEELKRTGQVTLLTPQIVSKGINPTLIFIATGRASVPSVNNQIDAISQVAAQVNQANALATVTLPRIQTVTTLQPIILPQTITKTATETQTQTKVEPQTLTQVQTLTQPATRTQTQTETQVKTETQPATETQVLTKVIPATATQTITQPVTETITQPITETQTQTMPVTITPTITVPVTDRIVKPPEERIEPPTERPPSERRPPKEEEPEPFKPRKRIKIDLPSLELSMKEKRKRFKGAIAWKQGFGWWAIKAPYLSKDDVAFFYKTPPPGAKRVKGGAKSAYRSIQSIGGTAAINLVVDMGIMDVKIFRPDSSPGGKGTIQFLRDASQSTQGDIILGSNRGGRMDYQEAARQVNQMPSDKANEYLDSLAPRDKAMVQFYMAQTAQYPKVSAVKPSKVVKPKAKKKKSSARSLVDQIIMGR